MSHISLRCTRCGASHHTEMTILTCRECDAPLDVHYDAQSSEFPGAQPPGWSGGAIPSPLHDESAWISLGEGSTPTVPLQSLGQELGLTQLWAKLEFLNPTGSFKDRGTAAMMSMAREQGITEIVEDSSGNAGASVSAYSARSGIKAHVFAPATAPEAKLQQIKVYGAQTHSIEGSREATTDAAVAYYTERNLVYASHNMSPYFIEGTKTFAYDLAEQFEYELPKHIVIPVGNGSLYIGAWKGFLELKNGGHIAELPRMHCIQARGVMPLVAAYRNQDWHMSDAKPTIAGGISVADPPRKHQVLEVLKSSNGVAWAVEDEEIVRWQKLLATKEGIYAEPTSAAAFAGLAALVESGEVASGETVLVPVTGFGLKDTPPV